MEQWGREPCSSAHLLAAVLALLLTAHSTTLLLAVPAKAWKFCFNSGQCLKLEHLTPGCPYAGRDCWQVSFIGERGGIEASSTVGKQSSLHPLPWHANGSLSWLFCSLSGFLGCSTTILAYVASPKEDARLPNISSWELSQSGVGFSSLCCPPPKIIFLTFHYLSPDSIGESYLSLKVAKQSGVLQPGPFSAK